MRRVLSAFAVVATSIAVGCAAEPPLEETNAGSQAAGIDPYQAGGGILGMLCSDTTGNPLGRLAVDLAAGGSLPDSDMGGAALCRTALAQSHPTQECKDYCETRSPSGLGGIAAEVLSYASFNTYIPAEYWAKIAPLVTGAERAPSTTQVGLVQCATLVGWAASEFYYSSKACERGSQCMTCDETSKNIRSGCIIGQTVLWCAQALGFTPPPAVSQISAACTVGRMCSKGILLEGCRRSCAASLPLAAPIAQPVVTDQGTTRTCCMCDRSRWEDRPLIWGGDEWLSSDYYYSPVSDWNGPVSECEGKSGTATEIGGGRGPQGYPTYYWHENCRKVRFRGAVCPADSGYHAPL